ncbi:DUF1648 domain-containing protein [Streptomyces sp. 378]|uniref:DUF1648 domain-containing protein n=1 Tax=Streptomyces sp. 378 TaxID=3049412 RepID=UPI0024C2400E|nr:DUF1648 domain-containing protein [Streptomyces sp. 378]MDK1347562.1 DUF1648 domain-containing protein [Streptomyces sp. 378]
MLLVALPLAAAGRLPDRLATHWDAGSGKPDSSMPLWAATFFPALIWGVMTAIVALVLWRARGSAKGATRGWVGATLGCGGVTLLGGQASVVRANLDHADWHEADSVTGWVAMTLVGAVVVGGAALLAGRRAPAVGPGVGGSTMETPEGERLVWLSRTSNPWLHGTAAVTGAVAVAALVAAVGGLMGSEAALLAGPFALASVVVLGCASAQARVSEKGLEVALGPLGWPARRWAAESIASARVETRTPAQVGGWGYRLSGLGTTVMLRSGECLVIRTDEGKDFAVSVDDAERGAALLNSLIGRRPS